MALHVEHELHGRRRGRNRGVGLLLASFVVLVFGLTVVKVIALGDAGKFVAFDGSLQPQLLPQTDPATGASQ